jgi:glycosyltransferase involved in cell wall biosynthesis
LHISVVSPVYKAPKILPELVARLEKSLSEITNSFEVILVDDGCPWDSWSVIEELAKDFKFIKGIKLSRNFGQHHAITAGLDYAKGDWIVLMDCDLQDSPHEIINLYEEAKKGFDIVFAERISRKDSSLKKATGYVFAKIYSSLTGTNVNSKIGNFGIYSFKVIEAYKCLREPFRLFGPLINWVGFSKSSIEVEHGNRYEGQTSYSFTKLLSLAGEAILVNSERPLKWMIKLGGFFVVLSFAIIIYYINKYLNGQVAEPGFMSLILSIWFVFGSIMMSLGIIGLYISRVFQTVRNRPLYFVQKSTQKIQ